MGVMVKNKVARFLWTTVYISTWCSMQYPDYRLINPMLIYRLSVLVIVVTRAPACSHKSGDELRVCVKNCRFFFVVRQSTIFWLRR